MDGWMDGWMDGCRCGTRDGQAERRDGGQGLSTFPHTHHGIIKMA
jgi:hypothetical protein